MPDFVMFPGDKVYDTNGDVWECTGTSSAGVLMDAAKGDPATATTWTAFPKTPAGGPSTYTTPPGWTWSYPMSSATGAFGSMANFWGGHDDDATDYPPPRPPAVCDCGGAKTTKTHSFWCSSMPTSTPPHDNKKPKLF